MNEELKPKVPQRVAEINAEIARQGNQGFSVAPSAPTYTPPTTITTGSMAPVTPMNLATPTPLTGADGLLGSVQSGAASFQTDLQQKTAQQQKVDELQAKTDTSKKTFMQKYFGTSGEVAKTDKEYSKTVDPIEKELDAINKEIFDEEQALRRQIEGLDKQQGTIEQKNQIAYDMKKESAKYQADLYVKQLGIQGRYDSAKRIADRKIAVELEQEKRDLEILKFDYEENKELFTKEEQRQFEQAQSDRERALNAKEAKMKQFEDTRLALLKSASEQKAPLEVRTAIMNAKTAEEAIQAASIYGGDILERQIKQAQLAKLNSEVRQLSGGVNVDVSKLSPRGQQLMANVKNLRFSNVEESKRIINNIATRLANGDEQGAVDDLKDFAYQKMSMGQKTDYDNYEGAISSFESAANQINSQNITAGPYKALAEKAKPYASIKNDKAYADLRSVIELGQAQLRKGFYGTAVTGTEAANARNFLIQDSDPINVISWKLENGSNFLQFTNDAAVARQVALDKPNLDDYLTYRVREKSTGQIGTVPRSEYDPEVYEIVNQ